MVCIFCLVPLFLIPVVNALPLLYYFILGKVYRLFGWEYQKPEMAPPACPYKPKNAEQAGSSSSQPAPVEQDVADASEERKSDASQEQKSDASLQERSSDASDVSLQELEHNMATPEEPVGKNTVSPEESVERNKAVLEETVKYILAALDESVEQNMAAPKESVEHNTAATEETVERDTASQEEAAENNTIASEETVEHRRPKKAARIGDL